MKKIISYLFILSVVTTIYSCGSDKKEAVVIPGMMEVDLSSHGMPVTIIIPDSTKGQLEMITQSWGATEIKVGKEFQVSVIEDKGDIELAKSDIKGNDVNKFKRFLTEEPNIIVYESEITQPEFHMYAIIKVGNTSYVVEDIKGEIFSEASIKAMLESAKSIKEKGTPAKASAAL